MTRIDQATSERTNRLLTIKYVVMTHTKNGMDREVKRFDSYKEAESMLNTLPMDRMGVSAYYIRKIYIL